MNFLPKCAGKKLLRDSSLECTALPVLETEEKLGSEEETD